MTDSKKTDKNKVKTDKDGKPSGKPKFNAYWIYGAVALAILGFQFIFSGSGNEDISWQRFYEEAYDRFLNGTYSGVYEEKLIVEFEKYVPSLPPWRK